MLIDTDTVNPWYVLNKGFKVYSECPRCKSHNIAYHKVREPGFKGIMSRCLECSKVMPTRMKAFSDFKETKRAII
jgi:uncharacterized Zn finger protein